MGILTAIKDASTGATLYTLVPLGVTQDQGLKRRSGTYAVAGSDFGLDPFGTLAAPLEPRAFVCTFAVEVTKGNLDAARDALLKVVGPGRPQVLTYQRDDGTTWVATGKCMAVADTTTAVSRFVKEFTVTWELLELWHDATARATTKWGAAGIKWGQSGPTLKWGSGFTPFTSANQFFHIYADGSDGKPIPTADETWPIFTINGPFGGDVTVDANGVYTGGGFVVGNTTATTPDFNGAQQPIQFTIYDKLLAGDSYVVTTRNLSVKRNGIAAYSRFKMPDWQTEVARILAGKDNVFSVSASGANQVYAANTTQPLAITGNPSGGTFTLSLTYGGSTQTTATIGFNATATTGAGSVRAKVEALSNVGVGNVVVTGGPLPNAPVYIGFVGTLVGRSIPTMVAVSSLTGGTGTQIVIPAVGQTALALTGNPGGGTFTITATTAPPGNVAATTAALARTATATDVYNALAVLSNMNGGVGLAVTGGAGPNAPWQIFATGPLDNMAFVATPALTGGTSPTAAALAQTAGGIGSFQVSWYGRAY